MRLLGSSIFLCVLCVLCGDMLSGCGSGSSPNTLVVYSPHGQELENDVKARFEAAHPSYSVQFLDMGGGVILDRVERERTRPGADVWWGGSPGDFRRAEAKGLLEPYTPDWTKNVP